MVGTAILFMKTDFHSTFRFTSHIITTVSPWNANCLFPLPQLQSAARGFRSSFPHPHPGTNHVHSAPFLWFGTESDTTNHSLLPRTTEIRSRWQEFHKKKKSETKHESNTNSNTNKHPGSHRWQDVLQFSPQTREAVRNAINPNRIIRDMIKARNRLHLLLLLVGIPCTSAQV